ncbi:MAG: sulfotransferase [Gammaproteobacteria bacterium]|nr:sulfotransferase [Gammaproteobacteria bacterium]
MSGTELNVREREQQLQKILSARKVFVGGAPKSGTTWLQLILNAHSNIVCQGEGHLMDLLYPKVVKLLSEYSVFVRQHNKQLFGDASEFPVIEGEQDRHFLFRLLSSALMAKYDLPDSLHVVGERCPDNAYHMSKLLAAFPDAKFIVIHRDCRDVVCSALHHSRRINNLDIEDPSLQMKSTRELVKLWLNAVRFAGKFDEQHPGRLLVLQYEQLLATPGENVAAIYKFLDVDAGNETIAAAVEATSFQSVSGGRALGESSEGSHFRKGGSGDWQHSLKPEVVDYIVDKAGAVMQKLGYL